MGKPPTIQHRRQAKGDAVLIPQSLKPIQPPGNGKSFSASMATSYQSARIGFTGCNLFCPIFI